MRDGIIYDCPNANCRTPIDTGKCSKACIEKYNKEMGIKPKNNADRIRAMSDEELAELFCGFCKNAKICEGCPMCDVKCAESELAESWAEWLKQPAEGE